jgi:hypothetical protein
MLGYEVWVYDGESVHQTASVAKDDDSTSDNRMDEMLNVIWPAFGTNPEDPSTAKVQKFFDILRFKRAVS